MTSRSKGVAHAELAVKDARTAVHKLNEKVYAISLVRPGFLPDRSLPQDLQLKRLRTLLNDIMKAYWGFDRSARDSYRRLLREAPPLLASTSPIYLSLERGAPQLEKEAARIENEAEAFFEFVLERKAMLTRLGYLR